MAKIEWSDELRKLYDRFLAIKNMPINQQSKKIIIGLCKDIETEARRCHDKAFANNMKNIRRKLEKIKDEKWDG